ncbi:MAG TPA: histidine phosphatase family protein [Flavobacteriales bacterium]|nr:histidine phosphatase family protein [Flavobacteriales bacterium]
MLTLFLVRHAKSSWANPGQADFDRPLNDRGEKNAPFMGKKLVEKGENPQLLVSSTAKRAFTTAKYIAKELGYEKEKIVKRDELYHATVSTWLREVSALDSKHKTVMMFGHNNGITEFANYLCDAGIDNIPTCGIVKVKFDFDDWKMVSKGAGELVYFDFPKRYKENLE